MYHDFPDPASHWDYYLRHWRARITASPLSLSAFHRSCSSHPDRTFAKALAAVIAFGADAGYFGLRQGTIASSPNYVRDPEAVQKVMRVLAEDIELKRLIPITENQISRSDLPARIINICPIGAVPKGPPGSGKIRVIIDPSCRQRQSNNLHFVSANDHTPHFAAPMASLDELLRLVAIFGREALIAKVDFKAAYKLIGLNDRSIGLYCIRCPVTGNVYASTTDVFGAASSYAMYDLPARGLEYEIRSTGVALFTRYSDDTAIVGLPHESSPHRLGFDHGLMGLPSPHSRIPTCQSSYELFVTTATRMDLTIAEEDMIKTHPPAKRANHIGWLIEPETMTFRVTPEKRMRAIDLIHACLPYGSTVTVVNLQATSVLCARHKTRANLSRRSLWPDRRNRRRNNTAPTRT